MGACPAPQKGVAAWNNCNPSPKPLGRPTIYTLCLGRQCQQERWGDACAYALLMVEIPTKKWVTESLIFSVFLPIAVVPRRSPIWQQSSSVSSSTRSNATQDWMRFFIHTTTLNGHKHALTSLSQTETSSIKVGIHPGRWSREKVGVLDEKLWEAGSFSKIFFSSLI